MFSGWVGDLFSRAIAFFVEQLLLTRINGRNLAYLFIIIPVFQILTFVVTLLDLSIRIVDLARGKAGEAGGSLEAFIHGKVLVLSQLEGSFDLVLLMGLLYPLLDEGVV